MDIDENNIMRSYIMRSKCLVLKAMQKHYVRTHYVSVLYTHYLSKKSSILVPVNNAKSAGFYFTFLRLRIKKTVLYCNCS